MQLVSVSKQRLSGCQPREGVGDRLSEAGLKLQSGFMGI
jgi:hypothetical protein